MQSERILFYDYGRFIAIIGVILVHTTQIPQEYILPIPRSFYTLGRFGVQLFFIISGATIWMSYNRLFAKTTEVNKVFLIKRLFRIVPLFVFMGIYSAFLTDFNIFQILMPFSGFHPEYFNAIEGGWSIWNEMYFYLLFPIYFIIRKSNMKILIFSLTLCGISLLINFRFFGLVKDSSAMLDFDYLNFFTQYICFIFGVELTAKKFDKILIFTLTYLSIGTLVKIIYFPEYFFVADYGALYWVASIAILCTAILLLLKKTTELLGRFNQSLILTFIRKIGQTTYTCYMIHFIVIKILKRHLENFSFEINFLIITTITVLVSLAIQPITENYWQQMAAKITQKYFNKVGINNN